MKEKFIVPALIDVVGEVVFSDGFLFRLPPDLGGSVKLMSYIAQTKKGWHKIDFGYWMYVHESNELGRVRFVGISPSDTKPQKDLGLRHPFTKQAFELYIESLVEDERQLKSRIKDELTLLIHDLRRFSNSIYQNGVATKKAIYDGNSEEAATRIQNTLAAQAMLSIRTDILDLSESDSFQLEEERIPVYRKFDKVVKSFQPGCGLKSIELTISGNSHSLVKGPDCAEIIAYILVDNALKYSPSNHKITVTAKESENRILFCVTSLGPLIVGDEIENIFEKGFRSESAKRIEASGTGYGLFLARSLVERFKGTIYVQQSGEKIVTNKGEFRDTSFFVEFPIHEKLSRAVHNHQEKKGPPKQLTKLQATVTPRKKNSRRRKFSQPKQ